MRELAKSAGGLYSFSYSGKLKDVGILEAVAVGAPQLETVKVTIGSWLLRLEVPLNNLECIGDIVRVFVNCPNLIDLEAFSGRSNPGRVESAADLVRLLRIQGSRRNNGFGERVCVDGVDYLRSFSMLYSILAGPLRPRNWALALLALAPRYVMRRTLDINTLQQRL